MQGVNLDGSSALENALGEASRKMPKVFVVIGINTTFNRRKLRGSVQETWIP